MTLVESMRTGQRTVNRFDRVDMILICAVLLSFLIISALPFRAERFGDLYFHREAKALAVFLQGSGNWQNVSLTRAPAPVLYYAVPYLFVAPNADSSTYWWAAFAWNLLWTTVSTLLIRRAGRNLCGELTGRVAAILTLLPPFAVYYSFGISAEPPAYVGMAVFLWGWSRSILSTPQKLCRKDAALALTGLLLLCFSRPNALCFLPIALIVSLFQLTKGRERLAETHFTLLCVAGALGSTLLVSSALKVLPGHRGTATQSQNFSDVLFLGSFQNRQEPWDWRFWGKTTRTGSSDYQAWLEQREQLSLESRKTGIPLATLQYQWVARDALQNPFQRLEMAVVRLVSLNVWVVNSRGPEAFGLGAVNGNTIFWILHAAINILALSPLVGAVWFLFLYRNMLGSFWPLWGPWLALLVFHAVVYSEPRYLFPTRPGMVLMTALVLTHYKSTRDGQSLTYASNSPSTKQDLRQRNLSDVEA